MKIPRISSVAAALCAIVLPSAFSVPAGAAVDLSEYTVVFSDDFDGDSLDTSLWSLVPEGGSSAWRYYVDTDDASLVTVSNGVLTLTGTKDTSDSSTTDYREGAVWTAYTFTFQYGYIEVRAKFDSVQGVWPAIWLMSSSGLTWPSGGEIDIMEHLNYDSYVYQTLHYGLASDGTKGSKSTTATLSDTDDGYHTYGLEWGEGYISYYVDGVCTLTVTADDVGSAWPYDLENNEFYLILSMQIGGTWVEGSDGIDAATLYSSGATMEIDYVYIYQLTASIPEPGAFGILAGAGALAFAVSRRRRKTGKN